MSTPQLAMVAGEASGDMLAALLLRAVQQRWQGAKSFGIGGAAMQATGFEAWWPSDKLAVRGYVEVLKHYREIAGIRRQLAQRLLAAHQNKQHADRADVFIGVDAPDFNLGLEAQLKTAGMPTVHFISPSIWAWRGKRIARIRQSTNHVLCLFPFEPALYEKADIAATYVGHPLANVIPMQPDQAAARQALGLRADSRVIAVLPGSRRSEIEYILPTFVQTLGLLQNELKDTAQFVLPALPAQRLLIDQLVAKAESLGQITTGSIRVLTGQSHTALAACDVTLIASGTATLEAALFKRPMVIAYKMNALSWQLMRRMAYQPWVGLPNILAGEFIVPECLQSQANPQTLAAEVQGWLDNPIRVQALQQRCTDLHHLLMRDTGALACDVIASSF